MNNDAYYEPPTDRAWEFFIDQWDGDGQGTCQSHTDVHVFNDDCLGWRDVPMDPTEADFDEWMQEQEDAREDALIARAEAAREDRDWDRGEW